VSLDIRFCTSADGTRIAYTALGAGPALVLPPAATTHLEVLWASAEARAFYRALARRRTVVLYDRPGCGLSDRTRDDFSQEPDDHALEAVVAVLKLKRHALYGDSAGGPVALRYAGAHPRRVSQLIFCGTNGSVGPPRPDRVEFYAALRAMIRANWGVGSGLLADIFLPNADTARRAWFARLQREAATPEMAEGLFGLASPDLTETARRLRVPTLVLHRRGDLAVAFDAGQRLAGTIPGARFVSLEGADHLPFFGDSDAVLRAIADFLGDPVERDAPAVAPAATEAATPTADRPDAALRIVLFTDAEGSTALADRLGDEGAREPLRVLERLTRESPAAHGGAEIKGLGDGLMASFTSATAALRSAIALRRGVAAYNERASHPLRVRVAVNAGESIEEEGDLFGQAVNAAARIVGLAEGGEVLVADVVRQLAAGKGFLFADRGDHALRGFEDPTRLWELNWRPT